MRIGLPTLALLVLVACAASSFPAEATDCAPIYTRPRRVVMPATETQPALDCVTFGDPVTRYRMASAAIWCRVATVEAP